MKTTTTSVWLVLVMSVMAAHCATNTKPIDGKHTKGNILFLAPVSSKSHKNFYYGLIEAMAADGHKITLLTPFPPAKTIPNVVEVVYEDNDVADKMPNIFKEGNMSPMMNVMYEGPETCLKTLAEDKTQQLLKKEKFDLAYVSMFFAECFMPYIDQQQIPFVFINPAEMMGSFSGHRIGNPVLPSIDYFSLFLFKAPYTFWQRLTMTLTDTAVMLLGRYNFYKLDKRGRELGLFPEDSPAISDINKNASLMIANSFRLTEHPRPYMPNILLAGGIHCRPAKPLSKDLADYVESSGEAGIIFFSLGSAVRSTDVPEVTARVLASVFAKLPQKVLWKYDATELPGGTPSNVRLTKWAPQQDLLGHPKMRLFISHGGALSTQEATYHGVPVLGLPVFGDQTGNMNKAEVEGWGKRMSWDDITQENLLANIEELLNNPEKRATVKRLGALTRDRQTQPAEDVAWWTGYLLRTRGAKHLRSRALDLDCIAQLYNVDVWLFVTTVVLLLVYLDIKLTVYLWRCCCGSKSKKGSKHKQKMQ